MIVACKEDNIEQVNDLLKAGMDPNRTDNYRNSPLIWAVYKGHFEITKLLLKAGADHKQVGYYENKPLYYAIHRGHLEIAKLLKSYENKISSLSLLCLRTIYRNQINTDGVPSMILEWNFYQ